MKCPGKVSAPPLNRDVGVIQLIGRIMESPDRSAIQMFVRILAIDEGLAAALVANDVTTLEEVAYIPSDELLAMQGLDDPEFSRTVIGDE